MIFYPVITKFDNKGNVEAHILQSLETEKMPENEYIRASLKDVYIDWFDSFEEAKKFVEEAKKA